MGNESEGRGSTPSAPEPEDVLWRMLCNCGETDCPRRGEARRVLHRAVEAWKAAAFREKDLLALAHAENDALRAAVRELLSAMEMQENRETGAFHIKQEVALYIWNNAKALARAANAKPARDTSDRPPKPLNPQGKPGP